MVGAQVGLLPPMANPYSAAAMEGLGLMGAHMGGQFQVHLVILSHRIVSDQVHPPGRSSYLLFSSLLVPDQVHPPGAQQSSDHIISDLI